MFVCQWHLDIPYGKQGDAVAVMRAWGAEKFASSEFKRAHGAEYDWVVYRVIEEAKPGRGGT
jgi:hypothetical protein